MTLQYKIQKGASDFTFIFGEVLKYAGAAALFAMAVIGTVSIDLVIIAAAEKHHDSFLTGLIIGSMFSQGNFDPVPLLIGSPITTGIAVILSFILGVPGVGCGLLAGWAVAFGIMAIGLGLLELAKVMDPGAEPQCDRASPAYDGVGAAA